ncbi:MAG: hypothetical protein KC420_14295 [Myxococcales bacterium]|nr:hypothetical protein [Myxococcales bacterium]
MRALAPTLLAASLGLACVLGYRGAVEIEAVYPLEDVDAVRLRLPDSPLSVLGDPVGEALVVSGAWYSVGGSQASAAANAEAGRLEFARDGRFAELAVIIPITSRDVVDLELVTPRSAPLIDEERLVAALLSLV